MKRPIVHKNPTETIVIYSMGKKIAKVKLAEIKKVTTTWGEKIMRNAIIVSMAVFLTTFAGSIFIDKFAEAAQSPTYVEVQGKQSIPPVLQRICTAESGGKHFNSKGRIISHKNTDGTTDWGVCQINSTHIEQAKKMGLDIMKEKDNKEFALYLFNTQGSVPWRASAYGKNGWINK